MRAPACVLPPTRLRRMLPGREREREREPERGREREPSPLPEAGPSEAKRKKKPKIPKGLFKEPKPAAPVEEAPAAAGGQDSVAYWNQVRAKLGIKPLRE